MQVVLIGVEHGGEAGFAQAALIGVGNMYSIYNAFAAMLKDGTMVIWDDINESGDAGTVHPELIGDHPTYPTADAFAALLKDPGGRWTPP